MPHPETISVDQWRALAKPSGHQQHRRGEPNRVEKAYAAHLALLETMGEIRWYGYEAVTLRLAPRTTLTPDFLVMYADGTVEFAECKGRKVGRTGYYAREDAMVKAKVAAEKFRTVFALVIVFPLDQAMTRWGRHVL